MLELYSLSKRLNLIVVMFIRQVILEICDDNIYLRTWRYAVCILQIFFFFDK